MMRGRSERPDDVTLSAVLNEVHPSHSQSRFETMPRFDFDCCVSFQSLWVGVEWGMYPFLHPSIPLVCPPVSSVVIVDFF